MRHLGFGYFSLNSDNYKIRELLKICAEQNGLEFLGISNVENFEDYKRYDIWLKQNLHANLKFMEQNSHLRKDVNSILLGCKSIIVVGLNYKRPYNLQETKNTKIAQYALYADYHKQLKSLANRMLEDFKSALNTELTFSDEDFRIVTDTAPLLERSFAAKTVQGFIGKNTCYIHPQKGSYFLLAEVLTTLNLEPDYRIEVDPSKRSQKNGGCGSCRRCQVHCPTGALHNDYTLDANLCLSYWTIEHRGLVPEIFWPHFAKFLFGCDICQEVCPYNRGTEVSKLEIKYDVLNNHSLAEIALMSQTEYEQWFGGSPMTRAKRQGLRRNALIAMWALKDSQLEETLKSTLQDEDKIIAKTSLQILNK